MADNGKQPVLVVVNLGGGNDFMNTLIPYSNDIYYDSRPHISIPQEEVLPIDGDLGFNAAAAPLKEMYDEGRVAVVQGIGYPNSSRSHFRSTDIWHTCEPDKIGTEGWLARVIRDLDPNKENVLTGVSFGRGLPRAMAAPGVTATSIGNLDNYGLMSGMSDDRQRSEALDNFQKMYGQAIGTGPVRDYLAQTGLDVLKGAEILKRAPEMYTSEVEYASNGIARSLRDVARVHTADLGVRLFYAQHGGYDTHANEVLTHPMLIAELSAAVSDFFRDLRDHDAADEVVMLVFTEFGRRVKDNGSGTDHGAGGGSYLIGERVNGGLYAEYPSMEPGDLEFGDLRHTYDFRGLYSTVVDQWMGVDPAPVVDGVFEQIHPFRN